jgi:Leucine-rich repeat (LRR) protein
MTCLAKLSMACNDLKTLPADLGRVTSLQFLDVSFNGLSDLPAQLSKLSALSALNVSFNPIGQATLGRFPEVLFQLSGLKEVNFDYTNCHVIEETFGSLTNLEAMQVRRMVYWAQSVPPALVTIGLMLSH